MNQEIIKNLEKTGLTEGDSKVYLTLLELGESSVGEIEKKTQLQRTSIYFSINKLINLGVVSFNLKNNIKYFLASEPERISEILEQRKKDFDKILPEIHSLIHKKNSEPEIGIFQGYNALRSLMENRIKILNKGDTIYAINPSSIQPLEKYKNLFHNFEIKRIQKGIKMRIITNIQFKETIKKEYKKYKLRADKFTEIESPTSVLVYGDYVQIAIYKGPNIDPINIRIKDKELAKFYKSYFEVLWKTAKS